ncbi:aldo/keto reductase [Clostridia bacterium]|nr:aldo/keto reductase [Clostridia bacterium]
METYILSNGIAIPKIGFGTWQLPESEQSVDTIRTAIDVGYRLIDSAQMYNNEMSVGKAAQLSGAPRSELFITTKLANDAHGYSEAIAAIDGSLQLLGMDYIDLFLIHWPYSAHHHDGRDERDANTWRAMETAYRSGKLRSIGVSNFTPEHLAALLETAEITPMVNQLRLFPGVEQADTVAYCIDHSILPEAYSPLGYGLVFGRTELDHIAQRYNKTTAQVCLRWSMQMGFLPIPKSAQETRMRENLDVFGFTLTQDDMAAISALTPPVERA